MDVVCTHVDREAAAKPGATPSHRLRISKDDPSLISCGCQGINLGTTLAVGCQHVKSYGRGQRGLGVAPRDLDVGAAKPTFAIGLDPAKNSGKDKHLPGLQLDGLASKRSLHMG